MPKRPRPAATDPSEVFAPPRIVGGTMRGRKLPYSGDIRTRPMKDRVREALFNLIGDDVQGKHALDIFAGTGALGIEALSRGAARATFVERHFPTADLLRGAVAELGIADRSEVFAGDAFIWAKRSLLSNDPPWLAFISPPWSLFHEQAAAMMELIHGLLDRWSPRSIVVVEADAEFDLNQLPTLDQWEVREYLPAVIAIRRNQ